MSPATLPTALILLFACAVARAEPPAAAEAQEGTAVMRGPLKIWADETVSKERGHVLDASGNVHVIYDMESGDQIESFSDSAHYDQESSEGELYGGAPRALWKPKDPKQPLTTLTAERIFLKIKEENLIARGDVKVTQTSSTLTADEIHFFNKEKRLIARGGEPEFDVRQPDHHTRIWANRIVARTEEKRVNFLGKVHGVVLVQRTGKK